MLSFSRAHVHRPPNFGNTIFTPTSPSSQHCIGNVNVADLVAFAHAALFSPALSTLEEALCHGHVPKFTGLSLQALQKHPPLSNATVKGHLDQTCQNLCSTKLPTPLDQPNCVKSCAVASCNDCSSVVHGAGLLLVIDGLATSRVGRVEGMNWVFLC